MTSGRQPHRAPRPPRARSTAAPAVTAEQRHAAVRVLVAVGLTHHGNPPIDAMTHAERTMAAELAEALGLTPTPLPANPSSGWKNARDPQLTGRPAPHRQSPLTGRHRPFERTGSPDQPQEF